MTHNKTGLFYSKNEERINALSHAAGLVLALFVAVFFLPLCFKAGNQLAAFSIVLYIFGMGGSYFTSTVYHSLRHRNPLKARFRQWDHAAIYWHIAGSYSPICLIVLYHSQPWGWALFIFIWLSALIGTAVSFRKMEEHSYIETVCFVVMGLSAMVALGPIIKAIPTLNILYGIIAEGVFYITGSVFYSIRKIRFMHSVFHFFVLLGSISHMVAVWYMLHTML